MKLRVYLGGYSKELEYRKYAKENYGHLVDFVDPMETPFTEIRETIGENCWKDYLVRRDKKMILSCDILVAYVVVGPTWGTTMEMMFAYMNGIPVYMIDPTKKFRHDGWVEPHIKMGFNSTDEFCKYIISK